MEVHSSSPVNNDNNITAYRTCLNVSIETHKKTQANQGRYCSIYCGKAVAKV